MSLGAATRELERIFQTGQHSVIEFLKEYDTRTLTAPGLIFRLHLPLLTIMLVAAAASPLYHFVGPSLPAILMIAGPVMLTIGILLLAILFDRVIENARVPELPQADAVAVRHVALYLHLPVSGTGLFFFIHPLFGYLMLGIAALYAMVLTFHVSAAIWNKKRIEVIFHLLSALLYLLIPAILGLFLLNILLTAYGLTEYY